MLRQWSVMGIAEVRGKIYVCGTLYQSPVLSNSVEVFDPITNQWSPKDFYMSNAGIILNTVNMISINGILNIYSRQGNRFKLAMYDPIHGLTFAKESWQKEMDMNPFFAVGYVPCI